MKIKTTNALMKYLRDKHNIKIEGSIDKNTLFNIGYYHSYKGYRFFNNPLNKLNISSFNDIKAIYDFDNQLKSLLYKQMMSIETITKNRVLQIVMEQYNSNDFNYIINNRMKCDANTEIVKSCIQLQSKIYNEISRGYKNSNSNIVKHFYSKGETIPLWAIFEMITLGVFGDIVHCMDYDTRGIISNNMGIDRSFDTNFVLPEKIIYALKPLRNSIAHNNIIYDVRFSDHGIDKTLMKFLEYKTNINSINFETITDYIVIFVFLLKSYNVSKKEINNFINDYIRIVEDFRNNIDYSIFKSVIHPDFKNKMSKLKKYNK